MFVSCSLDRFMEAMGIGDGAVGYVFFFLASAYVESHLGELNRFIVQEMDKKESRCTSSIGADG